MASEKPQEPRRWARDYVIDILRALDIRYIFGVSGTSEIPTRGRHRRSTVQPLESEA
jgi:thiamine pyrophosphate-dependent acetolactate synthase large subunit-like protein